MFSDDTDNDKNYQSELSKMAVATGGFIGKGVANSNVKNYLPMAFSDFIYAIVIEEYGIIGGGAVAVFYIILMIRAINCAKKAQRLFHVYLLLGLGILITTQALVNMSVAVGLLPVTGQTLPMVSMGGSSNLFIGLAFGMMLSVTAETENASNADQKTIMQDVRSPIISDDSYNDEENEFETMHTSQQA